MRASGRDIDRASGSGYQLKEISDAKDLDQGNGAEPLFAERDSDQRSCHKTDAQRERRTHKKDHGKNIDKHIVQAFDVGCELGIPWVNGPPQRHKQIITDNACDVPGDAEDTDRVLSQNFSQNERTAAVRNKYT